MTVSKKLNFGERNFTPSSTFFGLESFYQFYSLTSFAVILICGFKDFLGFFF